MLTRALLLGLSTGPFCLAYCLPVLFPLTCAEGTKTRSARLRLVGEFSIGRLAAYLAFGATAGYIGGRLEHPLLKTISCAGLIALAVLMIVYGLLMGFPKLGICARMAPFLPVRYLPLGLGFLTGFNVCPPFLMAVGYVFTVGQVPSGITFFVLYFVVTTLWLAPIVWVGAAARVEKVRWLAQLSALAAGVLFLFMGLGMLAR